ncbi:hypothetical protein V3M78_06640 [Trueperella pyogenes]|uniref:hypothetical protein n=1 Tax=Trueperella pyogenes TaxID=1661 RepID=UPI00345CB72C
MSKAMMGPVSPVMFTAPRVLGLPDGLQAVLNDLVKVWSGRRNRNALRQAYVDMKINVRNLGIAVPDEIASSLDVVCGWPEKAVYGLASRCIWDGVVSPTGDEDPFELASILHENRFDVELPQAIASELTHSVAFVSTTPGDTAQGEPSVVVMFHSAEWSAALWDRASRSISAGLLVNKVDDYGFPTKLTILTRFEAIVCETAGAGWFVADIRRHGLSRVPMEALPFRPSLDRPFGRSRITRAVMSITDRAVRTALRGDIGAELFTAPGLLLRGVDPETWAELKASWDFQMGAIKGLTRDENNEIPEVTSLPTQSPDAFILQMRALATEFAGVTSLPVSSLGVVQDNPASAEAIYAAKEELITEAANVNRVNGYALSRVYQNVVMLRDGVELSDELASIGTRWRNPAMPSIISQADAMVKQISAVPDLALTDVALEEFGYTSEQIARIRSQVRRSRGEQILEQISAAGEVGVSEEA